MPLSPQEVGLRKSASELQEKARSARQSLWEKYAMNPGLIEPCLQLCEFVDGRLNCATPKQGTYVILTARNAWRFLLYPDFIAKKFLDEAVRLYRDAGWRDLFVTETSVDLDAEFSGNLSMRISAPLFAAVLVASEEDEIEKQ